MTREQEYAAVKLVGEKIGYGNMMTIASTLWRRKLRDSGTPESGAFVPVGSSGVKKEYAAAIRMQQEITSGDCELDQLMDEKRGKYNDL